MKKYLFFSALIGALVLSACTPNNGTAVNTNTGVNANANGQDDSGDSEEQEGEVENSEDEGSMDETEDTDGDEPSEDVDDDKPKAGYTLYTNEAIGYSIQRPARWYWQHWISTQIGSSVAGANDIFATNPLPLGRLGSDNYAQIVIERRESFDADATLGSLTRTQASVAGSSASRYEGNINGVKRIEYVLEKDGQTYRLYYTQGANNQDNAEMFEHLVASFRFVE